MSKRKTEDKGFNDRDEGAQGKSVPRKIGFRLEVPLPDPVDRVHMATDKFGVKFYVCGHIKSDETKCATRKSLYDLRNNHDYLHVPHTCDHDRCLNKGKKDFFPDKFALDAHNRYRGHIKYYKCAACKFGTAFEKHARSCTKDPLGQITCEFCSGIFLNEDHLWLHFMSDHPDVPELDYLRLLRNAVRIPPALMEIQSAPTVEAPLEEPTPAPKRIKKKIYSHRLHRPDLIEVDHPFLDIILDKEAKQPVVVQFTLTTDNLPTEGSVPRSPNYTKQAKFEEYQLDPKEVKSAPANLDHGQLGNFHMFRRNKEERRNVNLMTNICAQYSSFNQGIWKQAETAIKELVPKFFKTEIACGGLFKSRRRIGNVMIADAFWKVVTTFNEDGSVGLQKVWYMDHNEQASDPLETYESKSLQEIENLIEFHLAEHHQDVFVSA